MYAGCCKKLGRVIKGEKYIKIFFVIYISHRVHLKFRLYCINTIQ